MNLYLISQNVNNDYETFDAAVVAAPSVEAARHISPSPTESAYEWCKPEEVQVRLLGKAVGDIKQGVICTSFNAG